MGNRIKLMHNSEDINFHGLSCTNELDPSGEGSFWKVQMDTIPPNTIVCDITLGITQNLNLQRTDLLSDKTFYGWADCGIYTSVRGQLSNMHRLGEMDRYKQGDCL